MPLFYSVQKPEDAMRLDAGGEPWPTGLQRANLGPGIYTWPSLGEARKYQQLLENHGAWAADLEMMSFEITDAQLAMMKTLDLTLLSDDEVMAWMERYSQYGLGEAHA